MAEPEIKKHGANIRTWAVTAAYSSRMGEIITGSNAHKTFFRSTPCTFSYIPLYYRVTGTNTCVF